MRGVARGAGDLSAVSELGKLYQDTILEHHKAPRHAVPLGAPTHRAEGNNPLCGDRVALSLRVADGRVAEVGCEVKGCAICRASGSMLGDAIVGREVAEVLARGERFLLAFGPAHAAPSSGAGSSGVGSSGATPSEEWGPLAALLDARRYPNRLRCATLPWEALQRALHDPSRA